MASVQEIPTNEPLFGAAGPGFEPGLSDSESELLVTGAYRGVRECGVNKLFILYWFRPIIYRVPLNIARVGVKGGVKEDFCRARLLTIV